MSISQEPSLADIVERLDKISERIGDLVTKKQLKRQKRLVYTLLASFVLDLALTVAVTLLTLNAISSNNSLHNAQIISCRFVGNQQRREQVQLWTKFLAKNPPQNAHQRTEQSEFLDLVRKTFQQVNCSRLYH